MVTINEIQTQDNIPVRSGDVIIIDEDVKPEQKVYLVIRMENNDFLIYNMNTYKYMAVKSDVTAPEDSIALSTIMKRINSLYGAVKLKAHVARRECVNYQLNING